MYKNAKTSTRCYLLENKFKQGKTKGNAKQCKTLFPSSDISV